MDTCICINNLQGSLTARKKMNEHVKCFLSDHIHTYSIMTRRCMVLSLCSGVQTVCSGVQSLCSGVQSVCSGVQSLCSGVQSLCSGVHLYLA